MARPQRRQSRFRPRLEDVPAILASCLAFPFLILSWKAGVDLDLTAGVPTHSLISTGQTTIKLPSFPAPESGIQPVDCTQTVEESLANSTDANRNRMFLRLIDEDPRFWISLHAKGYDPVRWGIMEHGKYYEQIESECFREILANSSRPRLIDVGGNIGWYTLLSASMGAHVDVFEPNPKNYLRMCESICVNNWLDGGGCPHLGDVSVEGSNQDGRIRIFPVGVGSEEADALFQSGLASRNNPGAGAITEVKHIPKASKTKYVNIKIMPLDVMGKHLGWYNERIDLMKIDVEGYELHVIRGAKELLKARVIQNIFMEGDVSGPAMQKRFREVVRTFADAGYVVFKVGGYSGPSDQDVPKMDNDIERTLAARCAIGEGGRKKRKKCNLWWKLQN